MSRNFPYVLLQAPFPGLDNKQSALSLLKITLFFLGPSEKGRGVARNIRRGRPGKEEFGFKSPCRREWGWELLGDKQSACTVEMKMEWGPLQNKQIMPNDCLAYT